MNGIVALEGMKFVLGCAHRQFSNPRSRALNCDDRGPSSRGSDGFPLQLKERKLNYYGFR